MVSDVNLHPYNTEGGRRRYALVLGNQHSRPGQLHGASFIALQGAHNPSLMLRHIGASEGFAKSLTNFDPSQHSPCGGKDGSFVYDLTGHMGDLYPKSKLCRARDFENKGPFDC